MIINDERNLALEHHLMATRPVCPCEEVPLYMSVCVCVTVCWGFNSGKDLELPLLKEHRSACLRGSYLQQPGRCSNYPGLRMPDL